MSSHTHSKEFKTGLVVIITFITMLVEIITGILTNSMALLADGIHMGSHVLAIGLGWFAYYIIRVLKQKKQYQGNTNKILSLSGYSSGILLFIFAFVIIYESITRFMNPAQILFKEAILVAIIGLLVNIISAFILHHKHEHSDHNIKAAYLHVIADAFTSLSAIIGLLAAMYWKILWIDALCAAVSSIIILKWAIGLLKDTGKELLDIKNFNLKSENHD